MTISAALRNRVRRPSYLNKLAQAEDLVNLFPHGLSREQIIVTITEPMQEHMWAGQGLLVWYVQCTGNIAWHV